jgi:hypothetical protein
MIKYRSTYHNQDGSLDVYEHTEDFYYRYRALYGEPTHMEKIETDEPIIEFRKMFSVGESVQVLSAEEGADARLIGAVGVIECVVPNSGKDTLYSVIFKALRASDTFYHHELEPVAYEPVPHPLEDANGDDVRRCKP